MRNIQIIIEYDGTNYCGWQKQNNGISIEGVIGDAIYSVTGSNSKVIGSGRTDAGVHAIGQSANFLTETNISIEKIPYALNSKLPHDIKVVGALERCLKFHSRFDASGKIYKYKILNNRYGTAIYNNRVWHVTRQMNVEKMIEASKLFIGEHDFTAFMASGSKITNTVRNINRIDMYVNKNIINIIIEGNGFLYNMVRIIIGTLYDVGIGKKQPNEVMKIIQSKDRNRAGITAPACGLYLKEVIYDESRK